MKLGSQTLSESLLQEDEANRISFRYSTTLSSWLPEDPSTTTEPSKRLRANRVSVDTAVSGAGAVMLLDARKLDRNTALLPPPAHAAVSRDRTALAVALILATDIVATLQSTALKVLRERGFKLFTLLLASSLAGMLLSGLVMVVRQIPVISRGGLRCQVFSRLACSRLLTINALHAHPFPTFAHPCSLPRQLVKEPTSRVPMVQRGVLGGLANLCAFYAVSSLNLGVASCVMFTMPLWTALLAFIFVGQKWKRHEVGLALSCLTGVILVTELWKSDNSASSSLGTLCLLPQL